jgi:hypothetical protein
MPSGSPLRNRQGRPQTGGSSAKPTSASHEAPISAAMARARPVRPNSAMTLIPISLDTA